MSDTKTVAPDLPQIFLTPDGFRAMGETCQASADACAALRQALGESFKGTLFAEPITLACKVAELGQRQLARQLLEFATNVAHHANSCQVGLDWKTQYDGWPATTMARAA
ncbi:MAG: hypothetical protein WAX89_00255 [Alphaproteobacteria bacterium]